MTRRTRAGWDRLLAIAVWFGTLVNKKGAGRHLVNRDWRPALFCVSTRDRIISAALVPLLVLSAVNIGGVAVPKRPPPPAAIVPAPDRTRGTVVNEPPRVSPGASVVNLPHTGQVSRLDVQRLMVEAGFPIEEIGTGVSIVEAESSRRPDATNTFGNSVGVDRGLWQINDHYWGEELADIDWTDPLENTEVAFLVWRAMGWDAWTTYKPDMDDDPAPAPDRLPALPPTLVPCPVTWHTNSEPNVAQAANYAAGVLGFTGTIGGYAYRGGSTASDHTRGLALDFMTYEDREYGWAISHWFVDNAEKLDVKYVIFAQQINTLDGRGWRPMEDRGGVTANHFDHPHISFHRGEADLMCMPGWESTRPDFTRQAPPSMAEPPPVPDPPPENVGPDPPAPVAPADPEPGPLRQIVPDVLEPVEEAPDVLEGLTDPLLSPQKP